GAGEGQDARGGRLAAADRLTLEIATPTRLVAAETVDEIVIPGSQGYFGVLPGHAAFLTTLGIGELMYRIGRDEHYMAVAKGFAEVRNDKVIVLADTPERPAEIDPPRAERAKARAGRAKGGGGGAPPGSRRRRNRLRAGAGGARAGSRAPDDRRPRPLEICPPAAPDHDPAKQRALRRGEEVAHHGRTPPRTGCPAPWARRPPRRATVRRARRNSASLRGAGAGIALALNDRHADGPDRRRRAARDRSHPPDARGRAHRRDRRPRRRDRSRPRRSDAPRADLPRRQPAGYERARGLRAAAQRSAIRHHEDRDADGGGAGIGHRARLRRGREPLSDQAVLAGAPDLARRERGAPRRRMATRVSAAPGDDLTVAYRRLNAASQQTLRYAEDVRRLYQQVQRAIYQSLLGLANALEAKDAYTRGHSERVGAWSRGVAAALGLSPGEVDMIGQAGLLHDI